MPLRRCFLTSRVSFRVPAAEFRSWSQSAYYKTDDVDVVRHELLTGKTRAVFCQNSSGKLHRIRAGVQRYHPAFAAGEHHAGKLHSLDSRRRHGNNVGLPRVKPGIASLCSCSTALETHERGPSRHRVSRNEKPTAGCGLRAEQPASAAISRVALRRRGPSPALAAVVRPTFFSPHAEGSRTMCRRRCCRLAFARWPKLLAVATRSLISVPSPPAAVAVTCANHVAHDDPVREPQFSIGL
jgi:hypothetical protein